MEARGNLDCLLKVKPDLDTGHHKVCIINEVPLMHLGRLYDTEEWITCDLQSVIQHDAENHDRSSLGRAMARVYQHR